jgi:hypothetical protein
METKIADMQIAVKNFFETLSGIASLIILGQPEKLYYIKKTLSERKRQKQRGLRPERRERWAKPLASSCKQDALIVPAVLFAALPIALRGKNALFIPLRYTKCHWLRKNDAMFGNLSNFFQISVKIRILHLRKLFLSLQRNFLSNTDI